MLVTADRIVLAHLERRADEQISELLTETSGLIKATRRSLDDLARSTGDVDAAREAVEARPEAAKALPPEVGQQVSKASPRKLGDLSEKVSEFVRFSRSVLEYLEQQAAELSRAAQAAQKKGVLARAANSFSRIGQALKKGALALRDQVAQVLGTMKRAAPKIVSGVGRMVDRTMAVAKEIHVGRSSAEENPGLLRKVWDRLKGMIDAITALAEGIVRMAGSVIGVVDTSTKAVGNVASIAQSITGVLARLTAWVAKAVPV